MSTPSNTPNPSLSDLTARNIAWDLVEMFEQRFGLKSSDAHDHELKVRLIQDPCEAYAARQVEPYREVVEGFLTLFAEDAKNIPDVMAPMLNDKGRWILKARALLAGNDPTGDTPK